MAKYTFELAAHWGSAAFTYWKPEEARKEWVYNWEDDHLTDLAWDIECLEEDGYLECCDEAGNRVFCIPFASMARIKKVCKESLDVKEGYVIACREKNKGWQSEAIELDSPPDINKIVLSTCNYIGRELIVSFELTYDGHLLELDYTGFSSDDYFSCYRIHDGKWEAVGNDLCYDSDDDDSDDDDLDDDSDDDEAFEIEGGSVSYQIKKDNTLTLTDIKIEEGVTEIVLPDVIDGKTVTELGKRLFCWYVGLTSVVIPKGVTEIGKYAFMGCSSLTAVKIPEGVTKIGSGAFFGCLGLTSVEIPASVIEIAGDAFSGCNHLTSFVVDGENPNYTAIDGLLCNKDCGTLIACPVGLASVAIPEGVTEIGSSAFEGCTGLTSVVIPESLTSIGRGAFSGCRIRWKDTNGVQYESAAKTVLIDATSTTGEFIIPNSVRFIYSDAFAGCTSLTSVVIPNSVTEIGDHAFKGCTGLTSVVIPSSVSEISESAFEGCTGVTSVTIPKGCKVKKGAFPETVKIIRAK